MKERNAVDIVERSPHQAILLAPPKSVYEHYSTHSEVEEVDIMPKDCRIINEALLQPMSVV